jgi:hypothetical protein
MPRPAPVTITTLPSSAALPVMPPLSLVGRAVDGVFSPDIGIAVRRRQPGRHDIQLTNQRPRWKTLITLSRRA